MTTRSKSINLILIDSEPSGRIKCSWKNWTGIAYKIPRTDLEKCKGRNDLSKNGVYFLLDNSDGQPTVYIGQAGLRKNGEGILYRLQEHNRNLDKDNWTEAVVFTTSDDSFGLTEISYLESRFHKLATDAKHYKIKNTNTPPISHPTEEKSYLEEFIDNAKIVMWILGHKLFEPLLQTLPPPSPKTGATTTDRQVFYIKKNNTNAKSRLTSDGIVVLTGSVIRKDLVPSCPNHVKVLWKAYKNDIGEDNTLRKDILFTTPSSASCFVLGASSNGKTEWKTEDGQALKDVE